MLCHLSVLFFLTDIRCKACVQFIFQMVCASVVSDLPSLFEAGYSVSPNVEAWRLSLVYTVANVWQFEHRISKWSSRLAFGNRDLV